ncbi:MAG: hypothetical protein KH420_02355, partial [Clostridiales bacterium]|nr:hypothetical protein [Clostridiales bacterium]
MYNRLFQGGALTFCHCAAFPVSGRRCFIPGSQHSGRILCTTVTVLTFLAKSMIVSRISSVKIDEFTHILFVHIL